MHKAGYQQHGFTIVELLVVIVVIGILAAITVVSYTGISQKAIVATLQSDLTNSVPRLKMYQVEHGAFPATIDTASNCPTGPADTNYCLRPSSGNTFAYSSSSPYSSFSLTATNTNGTSYRITDGSGPVAYVPILVTGCSSITANGSYTVCTFISSGTLTVTGGTLTGAQVLIVAGGGGGGARFGGGGGAGGLLVKTGITLLGSMGITVGNGGAGGITFNGGQHGTAGENSVFAGFTAIGGGYGAAVSNNDGSGGGLGGSGGGAKSSSGSQAPSAGLGTAGQGYDGTNGVVGYWSAGGGGGAGGSGVWPASGIGVSPVLNGTSYGPYAGGGGGGNYNVVNAGGVGGGGNGGSSTTTASGGTANTGGGGGGTGGGGSSDGNTPGGAGGSGIIIIHYLTPS